MRPEEQQHYFYNTGPDIRDPLGVPAALMHTEPGIRWPPQAEEHGMQAQVLSFNDGMCNYPMGAPPETAGYPQDVTPSTGSSSTPPGSSLGSQNHRQFVSPYSQDGMLDSLDLIEKKKAQNRAAQKAFRERKEARLRELEQKLKESEQNRDALFREVEQLKRENQVINNENRMLLQRTTNNPSAGAAEGPEKFTFPAKDTAISDPTEGGQKQGIQYFAGGKKLLTVPATWEYLHKISLQRDIDVYYIMQLLKGAEVCHGFGPAYPRELIDSLVGECLNEDRKS
ncbi:ABR018Cp [Eremothecium gossypii ATCC 10895]|uniref:ABR018Cp n=1 Tax=Eremothecium gossypii (strain ATCC 10895 / CBS 109.51 / FGSC 9923 / NRRL Y-1056) TaxID=284811 RepID=Q75DK3_EREGS|nr:ABR018Cp [Eremothecium gossypii ATCC 10895]AAS50788.1 ABR018Cp [Eremothecium gossypii ATCC 10895]AEY95077.1 FABR018Cp [Eremothecium gossypii FDAG1]